MNAIDTLFAKLRAEKRKAFISFLSAGDPDLAFTHEALGVLAEAGSSLIEVGFPFSDPIADGPVIQASYTRALNNKLKLPDLFQTLTQVTTQPGWATPTVAMASYSLIWKNTPANFIQRCQQAGLSGAVVPDLPVEEAGELAKMCQDQDFKLILLVTPTTSESRAAKIVQACGGFVYVVSVVGITGERAKISDQVQSVITRLRTMTDLPLCIGFGVSKPEHVRELGAMADGVIVGSALVRLLDGAHDRADTLAKLRQTVQQLSTSFFV